MGYGCGGGGGNDGGGAELGHVGVSPLLVLNPCSQPKHRSYGVPRMEERINGHFELVGRLNGYDY